MKFAQKKMRVIQTREEQRRFAHDHCFPSAAAEVTGGDAVVAMLFCRPTMDSTRKKGPLSVCCVRCCKKAPLEELLRAA